MKSGMLMNWIRISFFLVIWFILMFIYSFFEKYFITVKKYKIEVKKSALAGMKIIFLADFHHSEIVSRRFIRKIVNKVNDLQPDLIILGGDYVSSRKRYIRPLFQILKDLKAKLGVYGVIGNHDYQVSKTEILREMRNANIISLDNEAYWIKYNHEKFKIGGVADYLYDKPEIGNTINDVTDDDFVILVSHNPDYVEEVKNYHIDLMLSGHTHGGQVTIFGLYAPSIPSKYNQKYLTGLKRVLNTKLIISNGLGVVGLPIRFFAPPQIVLVELISDNK